MKLSLFVNKLKPTAKFFRNKSIQQQLIAVLTIASVSILGFYILNSSHATGPYVSTFAAEGSLSGGASLVSSGSNANGQAVQFNSTVSGGSGSGTEIGTPPASFVRTLIMVWVTLVHMMAVEGAQLSVTGEYQVSVRQLVAT
jgi:hypothetical protein